MYRDQTGPEGGGGRLAAKQQKEAEETNDELKHKIAFSMSTLPDYILTHCADVRLHVQR